MRAEKTWRWILRNIRTLDAVGGVKPFPDYPFIRNLIEHLCTERILIVCKSRQMMATWTVCAFMLFKAINDTPGIYLMMSKGGRDSGELLKRLKVMVRELPEEIAAEAEIKVKVNEVILKSGSRILALPATEEAPRMHSPAGVFWDEMAFTPHSEGIWTGLKPAIDSGGRFIGVSTPNGTDNIFHELYSDKENGFGRFGMHYKDHPTRDDEWLQEARRGLSEARWRQEYELDFGVLADRVYDEFNPTLHILDKAFKWQRGSGRTYRGIDFGYRHPYVLYLHVAPDGDMILFDEWEGCDSTIDEMAEAVGQIDERNGITESDVTWSGCDPAGAAVSDLGISAVERLRRRGIKLKWRKSEIMTGVEHVKTLLRDAAGRSRLKFAPNVKQTLHHLQHYRWEEGHDRPRKDNDHDHAMDALRYLIINLAGGRRNRWSGSKVAGVRW